MEDAVAFRTAQSRILDRYGVTAESRFLEVPSVRGPVHALISETGPPALLVLGFGDPAAMWSPLMAELAGLRLYAVDRPCFGLSGYADHDTATFRRLAVDFLEQTVDALELNRPVFIANSIGSLWSTWFAIERPERVAGMIHIGCPAFILGTSAPLPMRLLSLGPVGRIAMRLARPSPNQVERLRR